MLWALLGILVVVLALIYPAIAAILVIVYTGYNIIQLIISIRKGTALSGILVNGICAIAGIATLIWAFT